MGINEAAYLTGVGFWGKGGGGGETASILFPFKPFFKLFSKAAINLKKNHIFNIHHIMRLP